MTTLHDRLADLADEAPTGGPDPALWDRGRGIVRRRRLGTASIVAVVVVLLGLLGTTSWSRSQSTPAPAGPTTGVVRLPDRFYEPSRWLPSTDSAGPLGRLAAVMGSEHGLVGVAAEDGEYRYLDLPGYSELDDVNDGAEVALSADGRRIAYWITGDDGQIDGVGVYDTESGDLDRWVLDTPHGVSTAGLTWVGDEVWFGAYEYNADRQSATRGRVHVWDVQSGERSTSSKVNSPALQNSSAAGDLLVATHGQRVDFYDAPGSATLSAGVDRPIDAPAVVEPVDDRVAATLDNDGPSTVSDKRRPLLILTPGADGRARTRQVPGVRTNQVVAWRDRDHVVVLDYQAGGYLSVDVNTGRTVSLLTPGKNWSPGLQVSAEAWQAPSYDAPEPPHPLSPRLVWGGYAVLAAGGFVALLWWRRRVRA